ncbi:TPA: SMC family ATPase [Candidatus Woesearchaeota archaeon]|nr:SMC protein [archaeon GW2011_AR15]MBS3104553.1 SMC family ATPase [Candidatus Woesearchaeota archaeon]HIH41133.1 SMC family ATPase [Candidatus Woesearchaeota archaeon]
MILRSLKLENIRTYISEKIDFPSGSVLLSGDIGSGKSTVLLAVEFALFGILRSGLSGAALLRHSASKGSVELKFEIDKTEYVIKRTLRRGKASVTQDSGYLLVNGKKLEATPVELKAKIIEILGYPEELITKSKSLIYRFTVYTAQEEMKEIIFEDKDLRLDTLRKVFGIDRYKSVKENSVIFVREVKRRISELNVRLEGYGEISGELEEKEKKESLVEQEISKKDKYLVVLGEIVNREKTVLREHEKDIEKYNELKKNLEVKKAQAGAKKSVIDTLDSKAEESKKKIETLGKKLRGYAEIRELKHEKELEETLSGLQEKHSEVVKEKFSVREKLGIYAEQIKSLEDEVKEMSKKSRESIILKDKIEGLEKSIAKKAEQEKMLEDLLEKDKKANFALQKCEIKIRNSEKIIEQIKTAEICPTCRRSLDEKHRREVAEKEEDSIRQNQEEWKKINGIAEKISKNMEKLRKNIGKIAGLQESRSELKQKLAEMESAASQIVKKQKELSRLYEKKIEIGEKKLEDETALKQQIDSVKKELSAARDNNLRYREKKNIAELEKQEKEESDKLREDLEKAKKELEVALKEIKELEKGINAYSAISDLHEKQKKKLEEALEKQKAAEIDIVSLTQERKYLRENIEDIRKRIREMDKVKEKIKELNLILNWFESFFLNLMSTMEKHIMVSIHREFNSLVKEWFSILIDDIDIELDEEFSVRVIQDGYEASVEGLSGGEKTSVALAYRLALNRVINDLIPRIRTKELIILDEPTDGFSTEQLDKVRDVLRALDMKQTIIVSHEPKMESYVDSILRINKIDNVSRVIS